MTAAPDRAPPPPSPLRLERLGSPDLATYRALFRLVGADWLWFSRLALSDCALAEIVADDAVEIFAVIDDSGAKAGMLELDFRTIGTCELAFVGLVRRLTGQGHGRWLMAEALRRAWRPGIDRVWLHSCTLDHPGALRFYIASGFTPFARSVEIAPDPRIAGHLPRDSAPQVPIIASPRASGENLGAVVVAAQRTIDARRHRQPQQEHRQINRQREDDEKRDIRRDVARQHTDERAADDHENEDHGIGRDRKDDEEAQ
ncbi:MAG: GNAT family N-acetyltransferase [Sphingomonadales bacterium]|nr:GNAT family N-acetyltransferase [Sphingomonadales bacterium]